MPDLGQMRPVYELKGCQIWARCSLDVNGMPDMGQMQPAVHLDVAFANLGVIYARAGKL